MTQVKHAGVGTLLLNTQKLKILQILKLLQKQ